MKTTVLFVCMGNICRSPTAEAIFRKCVEDAGVSASFKIDSCGTTAHHVGQQADARMIRHAQRRGIALTSISRQFDSAHDFERFRYIIAMDRDNRDDIVNCPSAIAENVSLMTDYGHSHGADAVPDPYYGGDAGFEQVIDILEDACLALLQHIKSEIKL